MLGFFLSLQLAVAMPVTGKKKSQYHSHKQYLKTAPKRKKIKLKSNHKPKRKPNYMLGIASYYGDHDGFDGRTMANGDIFDAQNVFSAAHPILPLGTKLLVTNLANGRSLCVEVTDRMPRRGRVIDLSNAAALYLGMHKKGLTRVKLNILTNDEFEKKKRYLQVEDNDEGTPT